MPQFSNDENWELVADESRAIVGTIARDNAIAPILFPVPFLSPWFKAFIAVLDNNRPWYYGGRFILYAGNLQSDVPIYLTSRKMLLNEWKLLDFPHLANASQGSQFFIQYEPPWWFPNVSVTIYQYVEKPIINPLAAFQTSESHN
jgi:hypothetical protein